MGRTSGAYGLVAFRKPATSKMLRAGSIPVGDGLGKAAPFVDRWADSPPAPRHADQATAGRTGDVGRGQFLLRAHQLGLHLRGLLRQCLHVRYSPGHYPRGYCTPDRTRSAPAVQQVGGCGQNVASRQRLGIAVSFEVNLLAEVVHDESAGRSRRWVVPIPRTCCAPTVFRMRRARPTRGRRSLAG